MAVVDEKIAKVTLDNRAFTDNAQETIKSLERLKQAFTKVSSGSKDSKNIEKNMSDMTDTISKSVQKSESLLSKLRNIFKKSTSNIDMSGASSSIDKMNTDIANKTARTSDIISRLKGIFQKADNSEGFPNTVSAIDKLNGKIASFDASPLGNTFQSAASQVKNSISIMDIALGNFLANGMSKMASFGKQFLSGPMDGYAEYANKMTSIQTIKSNTEKAFGGDTNRQMLQINRTLSDLNEYADNTIYSFEDMTRNIGTFTAAGVGLEDSATAIKGISNLAAASGSSTMQASTAMYQLSQALSSGKVSLMDWNSVVNAGMGGELFKNSLYETADALGVARDKSKTFRDSLQDGWLTSEVLLETLKKFSTNESMLDAATKVKTFRELIDTTKEAIGSGWSETWEYVFGGLEEAKGLWSDVAKSIGGYLDDNQGKFFDTTLQMERNLGNFRNAVLKTWKDDGGQKAFFDSIKNSVEFIMRSLGSIREGFRTAFGDYKTVAANLVAVTQSFSKFTESLKNNQLIQIALKNVGAAVGNTLKTLGMILGSIFKGISQGNSGMTGLVRTLDSVAQGITSFMKAIQQNQDLMQGLTNIGRVIGNVFGIVFRLFSIGVKIIGQFFNAFNIGNGAGSGFSSFTEILVNITDSIIVFLDWLSVTIDKVGVFKAIGTAFSTAFKFIGDAIASVFNMLAGKKTSNPLSGFIDFMVGEFNAFVNKLKEWGTELKTIGSKIGTAITYLFEGLKNGAVKGYEIFKQVFEELRIGDIINGMIGLFALNKWIDMKSKGDGLITTFVNNVVDGLKSTLDWFKKDAESLVEKAGNILDNFGGSISAFTNMINVVSLAVIAAGILSIAIAIKMLSELKMEDLSKGIIGIGASMAVLVFAFQKLSALSKGFQAGTSTTMIAFSVALVILVKAMKTASEIDSDKLGTAVQGIVAAALTLVVSMKLLQETKGMQGGLMQLIGVALAMKILASALNQLKDFDPESLMYATTSMVTLMLTLVSGIKILNGVKIQMRTLMSLIAFSLAARILVSSLDNIASIKPKRLIPAVNSLMVLMVSLAGVTRIMENVKIKMSAMLSLIVFTVALKSLVKSVEKIAAIDPKRLEPSVYSVMGLITTLALATKVISKTKVSLGALLSIIVFTKSLESLVKSVEVLAKIKPDRLIPAVSTIGAMLTALVAASYAIQGAKPKLGAILSLLAFSAGVLMLSKSVKEIADLDVEHLTRGMIGVSGLMLAVVGASYVINNMKFNLGSMIQMITITASIKQLVKSVKQISDMEPASMISGMAGVSMIMLSLASAVRIVNGSKAGMITAIVNIFTIQTFTETIMQIGKTLEKVSKIPWPKLVSATLAITVVMSMLVGLMAMSDRLNGDIGEIATLAGVLYVASISLAKIAQFEWQSIMAAAASLVITIGSVALAMKLMSGMSFSGGGQLVMVSVALLLLSSAIKSMAGVGIVQAAIGLGVLAANLGLVLAAGALAQVVAPGLMLLTASIRSLGISSLLAAVSFTITAAGIAAITFAISQLAKTAPPAFKQLVEGFVAFITTVAKNAPVIVDALVETIRHALRGMSILLPEFVTFAIDLVTNLLNGLSKSMPQLIDAAVKLVVEFSKALVENAIILVQTAIELMEQLLVGLLQSLPNLVGIISTIAIKLMELLATELEKSTPKLSEAFTRVLRQVVEFLKPFITEIFGPLFNTLVETFEPGLRKIIDLVVALAPVLVPVIQVIGETVQVVAEGIVRIIEALAPHISPILDSITQMVYALTPVLISLFENIASSIRALAPVAIALVNGIVAVVNTLGSVIKSIIEGVITVLQILASVILGVVNGIVATINAFAAVITATGNAISSVFESVGSVFESVGEAIKTAFEGVGSLVESIGEAIKTALEGVGQIFKDIGESIKDVCTGITEVVEGIGGSVERVLNAVAGIFDSLGNAAEKAGRGFKMVGEGVSEILQYSLGELVSNLGAVANVMIKMADNSEGIASAGLSLRQIGQGLIAISTSGSMASVILTTLSSTLPIITQHIIQLPLALTQATLGFQRLGLGIQNGIIMSIPLAMMGLQQLMMTIQIRGMMLQQQGVVVGQRFGMSIGTGISASIPTAQANAMMLGQGAQLAASTSLNPGMSRGIGSQFGVGISSGISSQSGAAISSSTALAQGSVGAVRGGFTPAQSLGSTFGSGIRGGISSQIGSTNGASRSLAQGSVQAVRGGFSPAGSLGSQFGGGVASGIRGQAGNVYGAGSSVASSGRSGVQSVSWYSSGSFLSQGLANGINSMSGYVMSVAANLAQRASNAIKRALDIHSPSRVTYAFGEYFSEGFINGIVSLSGQAVKASTTLAEKTVDAVSDTADAIESTFDRTLDFNPTITPVIDMSDMDKLNRSYNSEWRIGTNVPSNINPNAYRNQNGVTNSTTNHTNEYQYDINVNVSGAQASNPREIAKAVQTEIKRMNDRAKVGRGEQPIW